MMGNYHVRFGKKVYFYSALVHSLLLRRPPGREAYPGDVWAFVRLIIVYNLGL